MPRTTEAEVLAIMDTGLREDQITAFLNTANHMVTEVLVNGGADYGATLLEDVEMWLAAHLATIRDPVMTEEKTSAGHYKFAVKVGTGLNATPYGQQVLAIDYKGFFASVAKAKGVSKMTAYGTDTD